MLKWLVQRVPDPGGRGDAPGLQDLITDDPLAVIDLNEARETAAKGGGVDGKLNNKVKKNKAILGKRNKKRRKQEIYSVNRTNPLYDDREDRLLRGESIGEDNNAMIKEEEDSNATSSNTDSVSSGYGSNGNHPFSTSTSAFSAVTVGNDSNTNNGHRNNIRDVFLFQPNSNQTSSNVGSNKNIQNGHQHNDNRLSKKKVTPSGAHVPLTVLHRNTRYVSGISMFGGKPKVGVMDVGKNDRYVSAIHFGDEKLSRQRIPPVTEVSISPPPAPMSTTIRVMPAIGEENADEISFAENFEHSNDFGDSIVTDSLLQMTSLSSKEQQPHQEINIVHSNQMENDSLEHNAIEEDTARRTSQSSAVGMARKSEDMDRVIMELTQAVIKSRNISTITKAMKNNSHGRNRSFGRGQILRNSVRAMKRSLSRGQGAGANAMRQLWEKSGMRTNGRKLLHTDSSGSNSSSHNEADELTPSQRRRRRKIIDRETPTMLPGRRFPGKSRLKTGGTGSQEEGDHVNPAGRGGGGSTSTSSVASSVAGWSPDEYQIPFRGSTGRSQYYSELYAEVYNKVGVTKVTSASNGGARRIAGAGMETVDLDEDLSSLESGVSSQKRVTFSADVKSPKRKDDDVVIDVGRLRDSDNRHYWESYYGAAGKFAGDPNNVVNGGGGGGGGGGSKFDYSAVFSSPYFDYRLTHSRASNMSSASSTNSKALAALEAKRRGGAIPNSSSKTQMRICLYWQSILTVIMLGCALVVAIAIAVFFMGGGGTDMLSGGSGNNTSTS